ncbi:RHS repeat-associated core domain-containing protein [Stenotrophomonas sp. CFBP8994]|uniref:RHS repeat-associated core domain-containing protein n=1 Tax=Stenotrophomonas sp. CFBP8994 TaxID=3096527 RepID=UPI002A6B40B7|nr:RHS repeat-associated core domain-containing protein [Stenotrophomonas sp. CFBP8994]MDY0980015.1 RHS repeat-associated core domain-containing protein [Stenotrophomonas sp. CFBP8994]
MSSLTPHRTRQRVLVTLIALSSASFAHAQEVEKKWETMITFGQPKNTEGEVQGAIENIYASYQSGGPFSWHVAKQTVAKDKVLYDYQIKPEALQRTDWNYILNSQDYATEDALIAAIKTAFVSSPQCPATEVTPGTWTGIPGGGAGTGPDGSNTGEDANYAVAVQFHDSVTGACSVTPATQYVQRTRTVKCPNNTIMAWRPDLDACGMDPMQEQSSAQMRTYSSTPLTNQCLLGNPCEPTTGNKTQPEPDLDYGWIHFTRYFQSMTSTAGGAFGQGWTHSHNLRLAIGTDPTTFPPGTEFNVGLIQADGTHGAFQKVGAAYEAIDGSGDRIVPQGTEWQLFRADEVLTFDAGGRLKSRAREDGTTLTYAYDSRGRLASIAHTSGRTLGFHYDAPQGAYLISALSVAGQMVASYTYTPTAQVATATYADGATRVYHYEDSRFPLYLTGITAEDNQRFGWYAYDAKGRVTCSRHSGDCSQADVGIDGTQLVYTAAGTTVVTDALGHVTTYGLTGTASGGYPRKVTALTDTQGAVSRTYYPVAQDFRRRLDTVTDRRGIQTKYAYSTGTDPVGGQVVNVQIMTEAVGLPEQRIIETHTDASSNRVALNRVGNRETRIARNARLQPTSVAVRDITTDELRTTTLSYCEAADVAAGGTCPALGLLKQVDGPRTDANDVVTYAYYAADDAGCAPGGTGTCNFRKGDLLSVTNAAGHSSQTLAYDANGRPLSVVDSNGVISDFTYHPRGWPTSVTVRGDFAATNRTTQISYWPTGQVQEVVEPDGSTVTYVYDAAQRLTDIADNAGNTLHYTLDNAGNRLKEDTVDAAGTLRRTLSRIHNTLGELTTLKDAGNHATVFTYDPEGNPASLTDALQRVTTQQHDPLGRLARTLQDVGGIEAEIKSSYNALDQVTQITDPKGLHTTYAYNGFGDLTAQVSPDSGTTGFTVDAAGNRKTRTDARGITATYHYDALNRLTGIAYADPNLDVGYTYDTAPAVCEANERFAKGRLGYVQHAAGSTAYCHDRFGQVTRKVQTVNGVSHTLRYAYTNAGRLAQLTYPDGSAADYVRDNLGRITEIGLTRPSQARQVVVTNVTHAPFGPATGWTYGNGRQLQRPVDTDYRPQAVHDPAPGGLSLSFGYDAVGSITELKNGTGTEVLAKYGYDTLGRLIQTQDGPTGTPIETYAYDTTGNRTSLSTSSGTAVYTYPSDSHRLTAIDAAARDYDAAGNTVRLGDKELTYNGANRLSNVDQAGGAVETYTYNDRGERVLIASTSGDAQLTMYDEGGQWLGNYGAIGEPLQQAVWLGNYPVAIIDVVGSNEMFYVQPDHLGTPRAVVDSQRDVAIWEWSNRSEVFGNQAPNHDPDGDGVAFKLTLRFPGQQATEASGLFYNYHRDYDPASGRYSQSDPAGLRGGISTYGYVEGNSVSNYDPKGLSSISRTYKPSPYLPPSSGPVHPDYPELGSNSYGPTFYPGKFAVSSLLLVTTSSQYLQLLNAVYAKALPEPKDARDPNGAKAPGLPCEDDGYTPGKDGPKWVQDPNGRGYGWEDAGEDVWIPTGWGSGAHGGPHWDVQKKNGGYINVYPGGRTR